MKAKYTPPPLSPEDQAIEQLAISVDSAIGVIQQRLAHIGDDIPDAKWSFSDLAKLLQLRKQLQGERPRTVYAYWVDDPRDLEPDDNHNENKNNENDNNKASDPRPSEAETNSSGPNDRPNTSGPRVETYIDAHKPSPKSQQ